MRVLQISADRSIQGILYEGSAVAERERAYGAVLGHLDIIGFSRRADARKRFNISEQVAVYPTNSRSRFFYGIDAFLIALRLLKPDVVSAQDPFETGGIAWIIAWMKGVPLHVQVHTDFLSPEFIKVSTLNRLRVLLASFILRRAIRVRVVSERIKRGIESHYHLRAPVSVLPIFVDIERFRTAQPDPHLPERFADFKTVLLVVSRLEPEKNVGLAISVFARAALKDSCLIIVGDGSERKKLEKLAEMKGVGK